MRRPGGTLARHKEWDRTSPAPGTGTGPVATARLSAGPPTSYAMYRIVEGMGGVALGLHRKWGGRAVLNEWNNKIPLICTTNKTGTLPQSTQPALHTGKRQIIQ